MWKLNLNQFKNILKSDEPMDCFKMQFKILAKIGTFRDPSMNGFRKFISIVPSILVLHFCATSTMYLLTDNVSLEDKLEGSYASNASLLCCIKMYYIRKHQKKLVDLVKSLKSRVNDMNEEETKILNKEAIFPTAAAFLILQLAILISCIIYAFVPVGTNNYGKPLPVHAWYPHYFNEGNAYRFIYVLQEISIFYTGVLWVCVDTINYGLLAHHNAMLKILSRRIATFGWSDKCKETDNHAKLCEHVEYHLQISRYQSETNEIYSSILFAKVTMSTIIICSFIYVLGLKYKNLDGGFIAQFTVFNVIVSGLFVLSWISEHITATSDNLLNKAAECNFLDMDRKTTRSLLIFMSGLSATVFIEVGSTLKVIVNLKMFVNIMDFAYKCLALLKTAV